MGFLGEIMDILDGLGWGIKDVVTEGAYSQFELDFGYTEVVGMADRFTFLRVLLKEVAKRHGLFVTFMPKPTPATGAPARISISVCRMPPPARTCSRRTEAGARRPSMLSAAFFATAMPSSR